MLSGGHSGRTADVRPPAVCQLVPAGCSLRLWPTMAHRAARWQLDARTARLAYGCRFSSGYRHTCVKSRSYTSAGGRAVLLQIAGPLACGASGSPASLCSGPGTWAGSAGLRRIGPHSLLHGADWCDAHRGQPGSRRRPHWRAREGRGYVALRWHDAVVAARAAL